MTSLGASPAPALFIVKARAVADTTVGRRIAVEIVAYEPVPAGSPIALVFEAVVTSR
jgi:hypothetical protein